MKNEQKASRIIRMLDAAIKSVNDWIAAGNEDHGEAEELSRGLAKTLKDFDAGLTSNAAQYYVQQVGRLIEYDKWSPRIGVNLSVLRFRLLDYDNKLHDKSLACWDWVSTRVI